MFVPIIILILVFILIVIRQIGNIKLQIWQIMLGGAFAVLVTQQISILNALKSINLDVMLFLFGMFVIGRALEDSGYLAHVSYDFFKNAKTLNTLLLFVLFGAGIMSAFLMNDTIAIIGTPIMLLLAKKHKMHAVPLLLALAFAITIGSVMSPIGNPQNLLIALNGGLDDPFRTFIKYLAVPTFLNLLVTFFVIKLFYREHFHSKELSHSQEPIHDYSLARLSKISLILVIALVFVKIVLVIFQIPFDFRLTYIALLSMLPILICSSKRIEIVKTIDWKTLLFFASMFIVMESVWQSGFFQSTISHFAIDITSTSAIMIISVLLSQVLSNVPLVALYLPLLIHANISTVGLMALAAGSTIAGNLLILGAASNIIIIQNAEERGEHTLGFFEFAKVGILLTIINVAIYWSYFMIIG